MCLIVFLPKNICEWVGNLRRLILWCDKVGTTRDTEADFVAAPDGSVFQVSGTDQVLPMETCQGNLHLPCPWSPPCPDHVLFANFLINHVPNLRAMSRGEVCSCCNRIGSLRPWAMPGLRFGHMNPGMDCLSPVEQPCLQGI